MKEVQSKLGNQILCVGKTNLDSLNTDYAKGNLTHDLPKYRQFMKCPTREDYCYTKISSAYQDVPCAALGHFDHVVVHLIAHTGRN